MDLKAAKCVVIVLGFLLGWTAATTAAKEIEVSGWVTDEDGQPLSQVTAELRLLPGSHELGKLHLAGLNVAESVSDARTRGDGGFRLSAPEAGVWEVVVRHPKRLAMVCPLRPLVGSVELPVVAMERRTERRLRVLDALGRPAIGARIAASGTLHDEGLITRFRWQPEVRFGVSGADGVWLLPTAAEERPRVIGWSADGFGLTDGGSGRSGREIHLVHGLVGARLVDARGRSEADFIALAFDQVALGFSDTEGRLRVPYDSAKGRTHPIVVADAAGRVERIESFELPGEKPVLLSLSKEVRVRGRVLDASTREPIPGAWIGFADHWRRTDSRGAFNLQLPVGGSLTISAVARGYVEQGDLISTFDLPQGELAIALQPALVITGRVVNGNHKGVKGATLLALPGESSRVFRQPTYGLRPDLGPQQVQGRSDAEGNFRLEGLVPETGYQLQIIRRGFAKRRLPVPPRDIDEGLSLLRIVLSLPVAPYSTSIGSRSPVPRSC